MSPARIILAIIVLLMMGLPGLVTAQQYFSDNLYEKVMNRAFLDNMRDDPFIIYDSTELIAYIEANMATYHIPGVAICVVKDSNIVYTRNFGWANIDKAIPVADTTLFYVASISKTIVANAAMQMWENGYLDLDADINDYIPFSVVNPYFPDSSITMRMILSHTSSISHYSSYWPSDNVIGYDHPTPLGQYLENNLDPGGSDYLPSHYLMNAPGHYFHYSSYAYALAGYIIEEIAIGNGIASSFEQYCQDSLFNLLGMTETSWFLANLDTNNIAMPYYYSGGTYWPYGHLGYPHYPAGQLRTSSIQLAKHLMAFMLHGELNGQSILEITTIDTMMTVQFPDHPSEDPASSMWGIGWYKMFDETDGWLYWGHTGGQQGARTSMFFDPEENIGFISLMNGESNEGFANIFWGIAEFSKDDDLDGVIAGLDNCPNDYNPDQLDTDADGVGDICDNCPEVANEDQDNPDGDDFGSACDNCPDIVNNYQLNSDNDSYGDACDNCPNVDNEDQADSDEDGIGDACEYVCGDVNGTQTVNILDITYLIAFLYKEGLPPDPMEAADVNGTQTVNILDITYLIAYLYKEGPAPNCG